LKDQHGQATQQITELVDLYPSVAELAGLKAPNVLQGKSLVPLLNDPQTSAWKKDLAFTVSRNGGESIRTQDWRFTQWGFGSAGMELFDLKNDPGEFNNLAGDPKYGSQLAKLKKHLETKRVEAGYTEAKRKSKRW
jgi:iduronate 2-sulfatase